MIASGYGVTAFADSTLDLAGARALTGLGVAGLVTGSSMAAADLSTPLSRAATQAPLGASFNAGTIMGPAIGGGLAACLNTDYVVAEESTTFLHGNLSRGVCPLGLLSQTFIQAVGRSRSLEIYLQDAKLDAAVTIARDEGPLSLFRGAFFRVALYAPSAVVFFFVYDAVKRSLGVPI